MAEIDISDLPAPKKNTSVDISDLPAPPKKDTNLGRAEAYGTGLVSSVVGMPGEAIKEIKEAPQDKSKSQFRKSFETFATLPQQLLTRNVKLPTTKQVEKTIAPETTKQYPGYTMAGELTLPVIGGAKGVYDLGKLGIKGLRAFGDVLEKSKGNVPKELYESLKTELNTRIDKLLSTTGEESQKAGQETKRIATAQEQLEGRDTLADKRQKARKQRVNQSLDELSKSNNVLDEDVGAVIQPKGQANINKLKAERESSAITDIKDPVFEEARKKEKNGEFISNSPKSSKQFLEVVNEIKTQIERTPEPFKGELKKRFNSIMGQVKQTRPSTEGMSVKERLLSKATPEIQSMTMDEAEFLRRMLNNKKAFEVEGFQALDINRQNTLARKLSDAMNAYDNRFGKYLETYKNKSVPIEKALVGRGKALTDTELIEEENALFSADKKAATNYYLDGSAERAERLLNLVGGKSDDLVSAVKGYFRTKVQNMNSKQVSDFIGNNEGLLRVFPELRKPLNNIVKSKAEAETMGLKATEKAEAAGQRLTRQGAASIKTEKELADLSRKYETYLNQVSTGTASPEAVVNSMFRTDRIIDAQTHRDLLNKIKSIDAAEKDVTKARQIKKDAIKEILTYVGLGGGAYYGSKYLGGQ